MTVELHQIQKHLETIERELVALKELLETSASGEEQGELAEEEIENLRKELQQEGIAPDLLRLVGTAPIRRRDYKADLQVLISARHARKR